MRKLGPSLYTRDCIAPRDISLRRYLWRCSKAGQGSADGREFRTSYSVLLRHEHEAMPGICGRLLRSDMAALSLTTAAVGPVQTTEILVNQAAQQTSVTKTLS